MPLDIEQIEANYKAGFYSDAAVLGQLIDEVKRLRANLVTANKVIVSLLGENADLLARLRARGGERGGR